MRLRKLEREDAPLMLEWMHDPDIVKNLRANFLDKTIKDCISFIEKETPNNIHFAIVSDDDEYMGTVSLKNIKDGTAELGIATRKTSMGKGYSKYALDEIFKYGFEELKLKCIYWYVSCNNSRAIRFYDKHEYNRVTLSEMIKDFPYLKHVKWNESTYIWYRVIKLDKQMVNKI